MTTRYAQHVSTRTTPQTEPIPGKPMVPNSAGGFAFAVDDWTRLERFLILGNPGGSYYATEKKLTVENAECVKRCLAIDAARTIRTIAGVSDAGRAPKNDPAIFALAIAAGTGHTALAMEALPKVARIGTHIFAFADAVQEFRGWGRGLRKGIAAWYTARTADDVAYQLAKYQSREGWSHRDLLRLTHPVAPTPAHDAAFRWAVGGMDALEAREVKRKAKGDAEPRATQYGAVAEHLPGLIAAMEQAKTADRPTLIHLIREHNLPRECIPTEALNDPAVWEALLEKMPLTALARNLGKMTAVGLLKPMTTAVGTVLGKLADAEYIRKSRLHPIAVLIAAKQYASGHGLKGSLSWSPVSQINDALDAAFYAAFANVEPANKRTLIALDVSGSMGWGAIAGTSLTPREGAAAMSMVTAKTEPIYQVMAFSHTLVPVDISKSDRLSTVVEKTSRIPMGGTDCSLPMTHAAFTETPVDTFMVFTDNETWAGTSHPVQALAAYRAKMRIPAKLIVVGMTATGFSIADPSDAGMLDVVGFDASAPSVMADFSRN
jgi:60 kDa SS-A/Ro ribonucleoprotein